MASFHTRFLQQRNLCGAVVAVVVAAAAGVARVAAQEENPGNIIAAQIRTQGFPCEGPVTAKLESRAPNAAVWVMQCKNATYRVRLTPNMAAQVERLE